MKKIVIICVIFLSSMIKLPAIEQIDSLFIYGTGDSHTFLQIAKQQNSPKAICFYVVQAIQENESIDNVKFEFNRFTQTIDSNNTYLLTAQAYLEYYDQAYNNCITLAQNAINVDSDSSNYLAYVIQGWSWQMLEDMIAAEEVLSQCYSLFKNNSLVQYRYAEQLIFNHKYTEAEVILLNIDPSFRPSLVFRLKGDIAYLQKAYTISQMHYEQALNVDSNNIEAHIGIISCLFDQDSFTLAEEKIQVAMRFDSSNIWLRYYIAAINIKKGKIKEAQNQLEQLITQIAIPRFCEELTFGIYIPAKMSAEGIRFYDGLLNNRSDYYCIIKCHSIFLNDLNNSDKPSYHLLVEPDNEALDCVQYSWYLDNLLSTEQ